jgi:hypothetical protein
MRVKGSVAVHSTAAGLAKRAVIIMCRRCVLACGLAPCAVLANAKV